METRCDALFVGVYDGYGGPEVSRFISEHLYFFISSVSSFFYQLLYFFNYLFIRFTKAMFYVHKFFNTLFCIFFVCTISFKSWAKGLLFMYSSCQKIFIDASQKKNSIKAWVKHAIGCCRAYKLYVKESSRL